MAALDPDLSRRVAILQTIPGVGEVTAVTLTIDMPELGELEGKQAASLAGLAPVSQQSGRWQGKERIQGGRAALRQALYFPAIVAARFNVVNAECIVLRSAEAKVPTPVGQAALGSGS